MHIMAILMPVMPPARAQARAGEGEAGMFAFLVNISLKARLLVIVLFAGAMVYGGI